MSLVEVEKLALSPEELRKIDAYWRAANYLSVGQIYLYDNPLLKKPLKLSTRVKVAVPASSESTGPSASSQEGVARLGHAFT